ncbi:class E sortase [Microcella alkalica]|uniref:class E sortase n=1 Tax=Microcella alkalica TaxID=355930 RepID=UPI0031DBB124
MPEHTPRRARPRARRRLSVIGVLGELLITLGMLVLLFIGWYVWLNDVIVGNEQTQAATELQQQWAEQSRNERGEAGEPPPPVYEGHSPESAPVRAEPGGVNEAFATLIVPRFGDDYARTIAQGVDVRDVLNSRRTGVGHYPGTQMPGEVGNFAIAAHRNANGAPFGRLVDLRVGDHVYVETADGWYEYTFRGLEYVLPNQVDVIAPVPRDAGADPAERVLTMTTCNPLFSIEERAIAYSVMTAWYPREGGMPAELGEEEA